MQLPSELQSAVTPLFEALPPDQAMAELVPAQPQPSDKLQLVERAIEHPALAQRQALQSGLWLYVDALDRSHALSQGIETPTGSFWHGIMHRREGDFGNSHYWFRRAGRHPAMDAVEGYDSHAFIDEVASRHEQAPQELIDLQRREWAALFEWCSRNT
jgi:hypothetical protein